MSAPARPLARVCADAKTLFHLVAAPVRGQTHAQRLESFYARQAGHYDDFRARMLHGRRELFDSLPVEAGAHWVDLGGGTAANLELLGSRLAMLGQVDVVDLTPSLLEQGRQRSRRLGWTNVRFHQADAAEFTPSQPVDVVTCSYSLSMMPHWIRTLDRALEMLRPGGTIGVVDFYVSGRLPLAGWRRHGWPTRVFWTLWFEADGVRLSPDLPVRLHEQFLPAWFQESRGKLPYFPAARVPHFIFCGRKPT